MVGGAAILAASTVFLGRRYQDPHADDKQISTAPKGEVGLENKSFDIGHSSEYVDSDKAESTPAPINHATVSSSVNTVAVTTLESMGDNRNSLYPSVVINGEVIISTQGDNMYLRKGRDFTNL